MAVRHEGLYLGLSEAVLGPLLHIYSASLHSSFRARAITAVLKIIYLAKPAV